MLLFLVVPLIGAMQLKNERLAFFLFRAWLFSVAGWGLVIFAQITVSLDPVADAGGDCHGCLWIFRGRTFGGPKVLASD